MTVATDVRITPETQVQEARRLAAEKFRLAGLTEFVVELYLYYFHTIEQVDLTNGLNRSGLAAQWVKEEMENPQEDVEGIRKLISDAGDRATSRIEDACALAKDLTTAAFNRLKGETPSPKVSEFIAKVAAEATRRLPEVESYHRTVMVAYLNAYQRVFGLDWYQRDGRRLGRAVAAWRLAQRDLKSQPRQRAAVEKALKEAQDLVFQVFRELKAESA